MTNLTNTPVATLNVPITISFPPGSSFTCTTPAELTVYGDTTIIFTINPGTPITFGSPPYTLIPEVAEFSYTLSADKTVLTVTDLDTDIMFTSYSLILNFVDQFGNVVGHDPQIRNVPT